ncbi:MAG: glycosyltransferase family 1 protein [Sphingobacteriales bacterium]|nr:MAG: glycosyltransferase family 1 protein [Sphingobacteriales bacterium]
MLTSCATDYITWANVYEPGKSEINGVTLHRFAVEYPRDGRKFRSINRKIKKRKPYQKLLKLLGLLDLFEKMSTANAMQQDEEKWIRVQGPYMPGLITYLQQNQQQYDALIFFTYLYYPTIEGIKIAPHKSILIPTAHDEPPIYFNLFKRFFKTPRAILYNTISEKRFVNRMFHNEDIYSDIVGVGIEQHPPVVKHSVTDILQTTEPYIIYIGRIEGSKGCKKLIDHFLDYKKATGNKLKLVFVGQAFMKIDEHPDIIPVGFVDEDVKITLLQNAEALMMPSFYESLSMVTLEGMAYGIPVIANKECEVLKDHMDNSQAGFLYNSNSSFITALNTLFDNNTNRQQLSENARQYVAQNYTWHTVLHKYNRVIDYITGE